MKKLISMMLVLLMVLALVACGDKKTEEPAVTEAPAAQPTEAPAPEPEATPEPAPEPVGAYAGFGLQLKNKTGVTINEVYIYPVGEEMGNSVVEAGWQDKDVDPVGYEKFIYIVREPGKEMEATVVFEDGSKAVWQFGTLAHCDELSFKKGVDPAAWEHSAIDKDEDKAMCDLFAALGKTADNYYPGYELIPVELKNKTGKGIVELYFYEEGGDPKAYNNVIDYLYAPTGEKMDVLMSGKAKEGGMYLFKCFLRPHADNYAIDVVFDDGTSITYPIEDWFKEDGSGNLPNEISLKNAEDPDDIKVQYDDGVPEPIDYLAESLAKGLVVDQWYPSYTTVTVDEATLAPFKAGLAAITVPAGDEPAQPAEPAEEPVEGEAQAPEGYEIPEGFVGLVLNVKNKTGKTITGFYIYPMPEDPLSVDLETAIFEEDWLDKDADGDNYEKNIYIIREAAEAYQLTVVFEDGTEFAADLGALANYDKISLKGPTADDVKHEANDDPADIEAMDAIAAAGVTTDHVYPLPHIAVPAGYTGLHLMLKNKSGKEIEKVYLFPTGEDKGKNIFKTVVEGNIPTEDESVEGNPHEAFAYVHRETAKLGAMTLRVKFADGTEVDYELNPLEDYTSFTVKADEFKQKVTDDFDDILAMDAVAFTGASTDGVEFEPLA